MTDTEKRTAYQDIQIVRSDQGDGGWSIHDARHTAEQIAEGDSPILASGTAAWSDEQGTGEWDRPTESDEADALEALAVGLDERYHIERYHIEGRP